MHLIHSVPRQRTLVSVLEGSEYGSKSCFEMVDKPQCCSFSMAGGQQMAEQRMSLLPWRNEEIFSRVDQANSDLSKKANKLWDLQSLISQGLGLDYPMSSRSGSSTQSCS